MLAVVSRRMNMTRTDTWPEFMRRNPNIMWHVSRLPPCSSFVCCMLIVESQAGPKIAWHENSCFRSRMWSGDPGHVGYKLKSMKYGLCVIVCGRIKEISKLSQEIINASGSCYILVLSFWNKTEKVSHGFVFCNVYV